MSKQDKAGEAIYKALESFFRLIFGVAYEAIRNGLKDPLIGCFAFLCAAGASFIFTYRYYNLDNFGVSAPPWLPPWQLSWGGLFVFMLFLVGLGPYLRKCGRQRKLDEAGFKTASGFVPKVVDVVNLEGGRERIRVDSYGVGVERYNKKKSDLQAAFGGRLESIECESNPRFVQLLLATRPLPAKVDFSGFGEALSGECSFVAGISQNGPVVVDLRTLPHLLIAGTTGGGKSVFFRQVLYSILKTTPKLQLYLLDLKKGVEMRPFEKLDNVRIAKTEAEAVALLRDIKDEMDRRFDFLEREKVREIDPKKHGMARIVLGVDEASVLYTLPKGKEKRRLIEEARELTDELAKLSRAAGIHLILATQKVTKETLDTRVQENVGGRMCFRMNTLQGSLTVLGNKMACNLPDIKGRGIWAKGADFVEVQTPFLSEKALEEGLEGLKASFDGDEEEEETPETTENTEEIQRRI